LKHRGASETNYGSSSECKGVLLGTISKDYDLLLLLLALLLVVSLLPQIIKHVLHIVLPLSGFLLIFLKRELPHVFLLEHVALTKGAHGDHMIILDRPYTYHLIHRSREDDWYFNLLDILDRLDHIFVYLPLSYLDKLEFLKQVLNHSFLVIAGMLTDIISVYCKTYLSLVDGEDPPGVPLKVSSDYIDRLEVEFYKD
jgi:hypothetical protein